MANLKKFKFTAKTDKANARNHGWKLDVGKSVNFLGGNDVVTGASGRPVGSYNEILYAAGIYNEGKIVGLTGSKTIRGLGAINGAGQIGIWNLGSIVLGAGNDRILADDYKVYVGIINDRPGRISLGSGNDTIKAYGLQNGLLNSGAIDLGIGNDKIEVAGGITGFAGSALVNGEGASIALGSGNDEIKLYGDLDNFSTIDAGDGNDVITCFESSGNIYNDGLISMGNGDDIVDSFSYGFKGNGGFLMGDGNDHLRGFGNGQFDGGAGFDTISLPKGVYYIDPGSGFFTIRRPYSDDIMSVNGFEAFGSGASVSNFDSAVAAKYVVFS